ncbi:MAG: M23 family metallopeptidase [Vicinamibacterales bacterium]
MRRGAVWILLLAGVACGPPPEPPRPALTAAPTHARYAAAISEFGLDKTALGQDWLRAANQALAAPTPAALPFHESGYLAPERPEAVGYAFELRRGRRLVVDVTFEAAVRGARLYVDLFEAREGEAPRLVGGAEPGAWSFTYEARRDGRHILRVQPELLRGGRYTVAQRTEASLGFPVDGRSLHAVQSGFGAPRDGGRRDHHGVDIFAPRGTPVVAAVDGVVRLDSTPIGGQVIWLAEPGRRRRLYYAHLNDWAVTSGAAVTAGQVIGYVGNTGNARTTPPHLHFGVYDRGPVDPVPYLVADDRLPEPSTLDARWLDSRGRIRVAGSRLVASADRRAPDIARLDAGQIVGVRAAIGSWLRVALPDGTTGFVAARDIEPADTPIVAAALATDVAVLERPEPGAPRVDTRPATSEVEILGWSAGFALVRAPALPTGWVPADPLDLISRSSF